jgi:hypothetical protein
MITGDDRQKRTNRILLWSLVGAGGLLAVWLGSFVPNADWYVQYYPAARGIFQGHSPYEQLPYSNPPWAALLLTPFAILPRELSRGLILVCTAAALIYLAWRLHAPRIAVIAMLLSPTAIAALLVANLDAFVILSVFLPPTWGLFGLMLKPQVGMGAALYDLIAAWREHRVSGVIRMFAPILLVSAVSALLFPVWIERMVQLTSNGWNRSIFPYGIPLGVFALWYSIRKRNVFFALAAAPFLTPYLTFPSYLAVQVGLLHPDVERVVRREWLQIGLCIVLWVLMLEFKL